MNVIFKILATAAFAVATCFGALAQSRTITGTVTASDDGNPLVGAALIADGGGNMR